MYVNTFTATARFSYLQLSIKINKTSSSFSLTSIVCSYSANPAWFGTAPLIRTLQSRTSLLNAFFVFCAFGLDGFVAFRVLRVFGYGDIPPTIPRRRHIRVRIHQKQLALVTVFLWHLKRVCCCSASVIISKTTQQAQQHQSETQQQSYQQHDLYICVNLQDSTTIFAWVVSVTVSTCRVRCGVRSKLANNELQTLNYVYTLLNSNIFIEYHINYLSRNTYLYFYFW